MKIKVNAIYDFIDMGMRYKWINKKVDELISQDE
jgi:hypothetical protein